MTDPFIAGLERMSNDPAPLAPGERERLDEKVRSILADYGAEVWSDGKEGRTDRLVGLTDGATAEALAALRREPAPLERERDALREAEATLAAFERGWKAGYAAGRDTERTLRALSGEVAAPREERETDTTHNGEVEG